MQDNAVDTVGKYLQYDRMPTYMGTVSHKTQAKPLEVSCSSEIPSKCPQHQVMIFRQLTSTKTNQDEFIRRFKHTIGSSMPHNTWIDTKFCGASHKHCPTSDHDVRRLLNGGGDECLTHKPSLAVKYPDQNSTLTGAVKKLSKCPSLSTSPFGMARWPPAANTWKSRDGAPSQDRFYSQSPSTVNGSIFNLLSTPTLPPICPKTSKTSSDVKIRNPWFQDIT
ncbi:hypothetical protein K449DRAFT_428444 [Hypoxylon sp. EC38]|nr:hypothetical protein K449DRAFT_428444 [Hypoxylon sp. EC38]